MPTPEQVLAGMEEEVKLNYYAVKLLEMAQVRDELL